MKGVVPIEQNLHDNIVQLREGPSGCNGNKRPENISSNKKVKNKMDMSVMKINRKRSQAVQNRTGRENIPPWG